ncbi:MAG: GHKL domain-containing protein [Eubacteriales bacterium]
MLLLMTNKLKELVKNIKEIHKHSTVMIENTKEEYLAIVTKQNEWVLYVCAILCMIIQIYNLIYFFVTSSGLETLNNIIYFGFYVLLLAVSIFVFLIQNKMKKQIMHQYYFQLGCVIFYLAWNMSLNMYQISKGHQPSLFIFITALMGSMVIVRLKLKDSISILVLFSIVLLGITGQYLHTGQMLNTIVAILVTLLFIIVLFAQKTNVIMCQQEILQVNKLLDAEKEYLRISLEKQALIMNELHIFYFEWDLGDDYIILSQYASNYFRCSNYVKNPLEWLTTNQIIAEEDYPIFLKALERERIKGGTQNIEVRIRDIEFHYQWYRLHLDSQYNDQGEMIAIVGGIQNIEEVKQKHNQINKRVMEQLEGTKSYFNYLKATQEKVLLYHHDMRHTLKFMEQLIAQGDLEALRSHSRMARDEIQAIEPRKYCENDTINLIIGSFEQMAIHENIRFIQQANLPYELPVTNLALCTLFFNLLENALFAARKVEDVALRKVELNTYIKYNKMVINVQNGFSGSVFIENDIPVSKNQDTGHGLGIHSIVNTVEEYGGMYLFKTENQIFIAQLIISL